MNWVILPAVFFAAATGCLAQQVDVSVVSLDPRKDSMDGSTICEITFSLMNGSYGTINGMKLNVDAYDADGERLDEFLVAVLSNEVGGSFIPVPVGSSATFKAFGGVAAPCKYISTLSVQPISDNTCNIRMMPEGVSCSSVFQFSTMREGLSIIAE